MERLKVQKINRKDEIIEFENGFKLYSDHATSCCEDHYLDFNHLTMKDFKGLEFDLTNDFFFERIEGYGIALKPLNGHPVRIPGYGSNNGYYSDELLLILSKDNDIIKTYDISECQDY